MAEIFLLGKATEGHVYNTTACEQSINAPSEPTLNFFRYYIYLFEPSLSCIKRFEHTYF